MNGLQWLATSQSLKLNSNLIFFGKNEEIKLKLLSHLKNEFFFFFNK